MHSAAVTGVSPKAVTPSRARQRVALVVAAIAAWSAFAWMVAGMLRNVPPSAGFDLELLMLGGRRVAAGLSPYDVGLINGRTVEIATLFYSYPPLVAQAFSTIGNVPIGLVLLAWTVFSGVLVVALGALFVRRLPSGGAAGDVTWWLTAAAPFWFPFTVAVMFGNLDAFFPFLYGVLLLAALVAAGLAAGGHGTLVAAGITLAFISVSKLHPASVAIWFALRGWTEWRSRPTRGATMERIGRLPPSWIVLATAAVAGSAALCASLLIGGVAPWQDYAAVLRAGTNADLLDVRNLAPSVQVALAFGLGPDAVRLGQVVITIVAIAATAVAALRLRDPAASLFVATIASFVILPVTWFHYFGILIPFAVVAVVRASPGTPTRNVRVLLALAFVTGILGFGQPVAWLIPVLIGVAVAVSSGAITARASRLTRG